MGPKKQEEEENVFFLPEGDDEAANAELLDTDAAESEPPGVDKEKEEELATRTGMTTGTSKCDGPTTTSKMAASSMPALQRSARGTGSNSSPGAIAIAGACSVSMLVEGGEETAGIGSGGGGILVAGAAAESADCVDISIRSGPPQLQPHGYDMEEGNLCNLVEAELVTENMNHQELQGPLAVAEPAPRDKNGWYLAGGLLLIATVVIVLATTLTRNDANSEPMPANADNTTDNMSYMESLQWGNTIIGSAPYDRFGAPLAMNSHGTILAVGARNNGNAGFESGLVRVFQIEAVGSNIQNDEHRVIWTQQGNAIGGQAEGDHFAYSGMAMSTDGARLAVGAPYYSASFPTGEVVPAAGNVRVFELVSSTWSQVGPSIDGLGADDLFGRHVSMSADGNIVAGSSGQSSSYVRIFRGQAATNETKSDGGAMETYWEQMGSTLGGEDAPSDRFGRAFDLSSSGFRIAVGATQNKKGAAGSGYVQVYDFNGIEWNQVGHDIVGDNDQDGFGRGVALNYDGSVLACGALDADENGESSGLVRIYRLVEDDAGTATWEEIGEIIGAAENDELGATLMLSADGSRVAVGASQRDRDVGAGYVQIFDYDSTAGKWNQNGHTLEGFADGDRFGAAVQMSASGLILAVGSVASDANGDDSGHVQVFDLEKL